MEYLRGRGLVGACDDATVQPLRGGVSNVVLAVSTQERRVIVKQALPQLRVAEEWFAKKERAITEARALRAVARLFPQSVPEVYDLDEEQCALVIEAAPQDWVVWKDELLQGRVARDHAGQLGRHIGLMHAMSRGPGWQDFDDRAAFDQLRVEPYYETIAARHPDVALAVGRAVEAMRQRKSCLVHGDCSPKNVLLGRDRLWLIDFEVAHLGDPVFDVAFLLNHLLLKTIARPQQRRAYAECAAAFLNAYVLAGGDGSDDGEYLNLHLGCLLLARVDGKSPVEYLDEAKRNVARALGRRIVSDPPRERLAAWQVLAY